MLIYKRALNRFAYFKQTTYADVAELVDALDSKSSGKPCGFESHHQYQDIFV